MKLNQIKSEYLFLIFTFLVASLSLFIGAKDWHQWDTDSYLEAGTVFLSGGIDIFRTPVYPIILKGFNMWCGDYYYVAVIVLQLAVFVYSVHRFRCICTFLWGTSRIKWVVLSLYAFHPTMLFWHKILLTESLSLSVGVVYLYFLIRFLQRPSQKAVWCSQAGLCFLLFIRPSFLYLLPLNVLFWIWQFVRKRIKLTWIALACSVGILGLYVGYTHAFGRVYGQNMVSEVGDINQYWILREADLVDEDLVDNPAMRKDLLRFKKQGVVYRSDHILEFIELQEKYGLPACHKMVWSSIQEHFRHYKRARRNSFWQESTHTVGCWEEQTDTLTRIGFFISPNFFQFLSFLLVYLVFYLFVQRKDDKEFFSAFLFLSVLGALVVAVFGSPNAWGRLIVPAIPAAMLMLGQVGKYILCRIQIKRQVGYGKEKA